jgi:hypothetical protein
MKPIVSIARQDERVADRDETMPQVWLAAI